MIGISNYDASVIMRLLGEIGRLNGCDPHTKNIKRKAILLSRKIEKKQKRKTL